MQLEGVVSNVTNFGAFVDVGVHQDGLVHISALSEQFVKDPRTVVKAGDIVKVKVMEVDVQRKRIGLSMRLSDKPQDADGQSNKGDRGEKGKGRGPSDQRRGGGKPRSGGASQPGKSQQPAGAMANALAAALKKK